MTCALERADRDGIVPHVIQHDLDQALDALEALELLFDKLLPDHPTESRTNAIAAFGSVLAADRVRIRSRVKGTAEWEREWASSSRRILVGRERTCDIRIDSHALSGAHLEFERFGSRVAVRDLESHNGSWHSHEGTTVKLTPFVARRVVPGDIIDAGGGVEFSIQPPPRERFSYDGEQLLSLSDDLKILARAIAELKNAGDPVGPKTLAARLGEVPGFSERSINRRVSDLRELLKISYLVQRDAGYAEIARIVRRRGLLEDDA